jgi:beta-lactam-binding protein with PASTA domain
MIGPGHVRIKLLAVLLNGCLLQFLLLFLCVAAPPAACAQEKVQPKAAASKKSAAAKPADASKPVAYTFVAQPQQPKSPCGSGELAVVSVPNVVGHSVSEAKMYLQNTGLKLGSTVPVTAQGAVGTVLTQDPSSQSRIACGSIVNVWYINQSSPGKEGGSRDLVVVPDVRNMSEDRAVEALHNRHLHLLEAKRVQTDKVIAGIVVDQAPAPGKKVTPESSVRVAVSFAPPKQGGGGAPAPGGEVSYPGPQLPCGVPGKSKAVAPALRGHTQHEAELSLHAIGLKTGTVVTLSTDAGQPGTVFKQKPDADTGVVCGGSVDLYVAAAISPPDQATTTHPQPRKKFPVPDVRRMDETQAVEVLHQSGFHLGDVSRRQFPNLTPGTIADQSPPPRSLAEEGSAVSVTLASPQSTTVPNVIGQTVAKAVTILRNAGLQPGSISEKGSSDASGIVTDQQPRANAQIDRGGSVSLEVSRQIQFSLFCHPNASDPAIGQEISFSCRTVPPAVDAQYQFFFGDGPPLSQADSTFPHVYNVARHYDAHGVAVIHGREITGGLIPVDVRDVTLTVTMVNPLANANVGDSVTLTAESQPANPLTEYDFIFSDNKHSGFQSARTYQRSFNSKGTYSVMVVARVGQGREARSNFTRLDVVPGSSWPLAGTAAAIVLGGGALLQYRRRGWPFNEKLQPSFVPRTDAGQQSLDVKGDLPTLEIRLRPVLSFGGQTIVATRPTAN